MCSELLDSEHHGKDNFQYDMCTIYSITKATRNPHYRVTKYLSLLVSPWQLISMPLPTAITQIAGND